MSLMKKLAPIIIAALVLLSACGKEASHGQSLPQEETPNLTVEFAADTQAESESSSPVEEILPEPEFSDTGADDAFAEYMASVERQAEQTEAALQEATTQMEMSSHAAALYTLWDDALNYLWAELKPLLPEDEFSKILDEQLVWITNKEAAIAEAGKQFEGGSAYSMAVSIQGAQITKERVYELYELLKQAQ